MLDTPLSASDEVRFRQMTNWSPAGLGQEDPLPGHSEADPTVGVFIPAEVGHRGPRLAGLPPFWHMCNRLGGHPDQQQGPPGHLLLSFLWWVRVQTCCSMKEPNTMFSRAVTYSEPWPGVYSGVPPKESSVLINALLVHHYKRGAYYPKGGASEIAFHIIRTIQKYGGNCLVRAPVSEIMVNEKGAAYGEKRLRLISDQLRVKCSACNGLRPSAVWQVWKWGKVWRKWRFTLLWLFQTVASSPPSRNFSPLRFKSGQVRNRSRYLLIKELQFQWLIWWFWTRRAVDIQDRLNMMKHGRGSFLVFSGFDGTEEELGLESTNYWLFKNNDMDKS